MSAPPSRWAVTIPEAVFHRHPSPLALTLYAHLLRAGQGGPAWHIPDQEVQMPDDLPSFSESNSVFIPFMVLSMELSAQAKALYLHLKHRCGEHGDIYRASDHQVAQRAKLPRRQVQATLAELSEQGLIAVSPIAGGQEMWIQDIWELNDEFCALVEGGAR